MNKQHKICIISHAHLTNNPRVLKEAISLSNAGYSVSIITILTKEVLLKLDRQLIKERNINYENSVNLIPGQVSSFRIFFSKFIRKIFELLSVYLKIELPHLLTYRLNEILGKAKKEDADLYICHNEPGLWVGAKLADIRKKVAFDFEDWYSRDYLVPGRPVKLLADLERNAMKVGKYITTTSYSLAKALHNEYKFTKPKVIYNAFSLSEREGIEWGRVEQKNNLSLYWFSQTIGSGRGLEQLIEALNLIDKTVSLHLRGNIKDEYKNYLQSHLDTKHEIFFHEPVQPSKILEAMQRFDLGLSLELNYPPSRNLTVTNKILHYLLAGLPVIASDTLGNREISGRSNGAVEIINLNNPGKTAEVIMSLNEDRQKLVAMNEQARKISTEVFNWEVQEKVLLSCVQDALA